MLRRDQGTGRAAQRSLVLPRALEGHQGRSLFAARTHRGATSSNSVRAPNTGIGQRDGARRQDRERVQGSARLEPADRRAVRATLTGTGRGARA
jgi:hypothetical protein